MGNALAFTPMRTPMTRENLARRASAVLGINVGPEDLPKIEVRNFIDPKALELGRQMSNKAREWFRRPFTSTGPISEKRRPAG